MGRIVVLLLLQAGVIPVLSQYRTLPYSNTPQFSEYGDYGRYFSGNTEESAERENQRDYSLQQPSFFMFDNKNENNAEKQSVDRVASDGYSTTTVSSLIGGKGSYGGLTSPPPPSDSSDLQVNEDSRTKYFSNEKHAVVPSSLRELEESYIRSLSASSSSAASVPPTKQSLQDPYGEDTEQTSTPGVENYAGFLMENRRLSENEHGTRSISNEQQGRQNLQQEADQNAPITYGFPLLNEQQRASATSNSIETAYKRNGGRGRGPKRKVYDFTSKNNIVPNFPDFADRPPIPEEPESPPGTEDTIEQATRKPPVKLLLPHPQSLKSFGYPQPLSSPPSDFDPSFPGPVLERGFIPSFGPPTKNPFNRPLKESHPNFLLGPKDNHLQQLQSHIHLAHMKNHNIPTTSAVPVLRPVGSNKEENILPDEVSSSAQDHESDEKPREGTVYKHISVHISPEDLDEGVSAPKIVKVAKNPNKHIQLIVVKANEEAQKTSYEVEVPPTPPQKTLVYVLSESGGTRQPIRLVKPTPLKPAPPQVFFLRYTDPHNGVVHRHPPASDEREQTSPESRDVGQSQGTRPIKQLASPRDPDAELLRSAPPPVLPTFTTFRNPGSTLGHLQSSLAAPTLFSLTSNNFENTNDINDPTNSKFHGGATAASTSPAALLSPNGNGHLAALHYNNANNFPPSTAQSQVQLISNKNAFYHSPNVYSSLYNLYPPPALTSLPNQDLFPYYNPVNIYQQQQQTLQSHPVPQHQFYHLGNAGQTSSSPKLSGGTAENEESSSIQGLYTVPPYLKNLPGSVNFNSLIQNPDGNNLPRATRNYAMMTYAPTYMPSASGSDHVPVFTSPAEFIKSLLGDSYMYYNHIRNNNNNSHHQYAEFLSLEAQAPKTTTTTTTPPPKSAQNQSQQHTFPLVFNHENSQNISRSQTQNHQSQPFTIVISNGGNSYQIDKNSAHFQYTSNTEHPPFSTPVNPHLTPRFLTTSSTTTTTSRPRVSRAPASTPPPALSHSAPTPTPRQIINLPIIIYEGGTGKNKRVFPNRLTTGETVSSHFSNLFSNFTTPSPENANNNNYYSGEKSAESSSQSDSSGASDEVGSSQQLSSGEEDLLQAYYDSSRSNYNSTVLFQNHHHNSTGSASVGGKQGKSRKRVNPANVKPGRRLRKVRKPHKNKKNKHEEEEAQSESSTDTRS